MKKHLMQRFMVDNNIHYCKSHLHLHEYLHPNETFSSFTFLDSLGALYIHLSEFKRVGNGVYLMKLDSKHHLNC